MQLGENPDLVFNVGGLGVDAIKNINLLTKSELENSLGIKFNNKNLLITFHPVTLEKNTSHSQMVELLNALSDFKDTCLIFTMPNADTAGLIYRQAFMALAEQKDNVKLIENFGTQSYFTCMKYAKLLIGNTSSGILEAASFNKYVLNLGDRQKGRLCSSNVVHLPFDSNEIIAKTNEYVYSIYQGENIYFQQNPSSQIINLIKREYAATL
jgi:GDP/UDP-N,N'-diacetylbacillosamine 2-epimerase (hydrolysing)